MAIFDSSPDQPSSLRAGRGASTSMSGAAGDSPDRAEQGSACLTREESDAPKSSDREEGYPSWLPKRPPPPAPASTFHSSSVMPSAYDDAALEDTGEDNSLGHRASFAIGRKPTPRSVRIVSVGAQEQGEKAEPRYERNRDPTEQSRLTQAAQARVWSRGTAAMSPTVFAGSMLASRAHRPRLRAPTLHVELLRSPSSWTRLWFYLYPLFVFTHIPLQTFFDFNAVFVLLQASRFPNPVTPGVSGSGRNWALGAAAYVACWLVWILVVFVVYELIYSFYRRWRVKRPLILPIYLSSPAFSFACMTSFSNFCFFQHIRASARPALPSFLRRKSSASSAESRGAVSPSPSPTQQNLPLASWRDFIAETCFFYSQNIPTVALLLPRAALCLALLFAFSSPLPQEVALGNAGLQRRDATFFRNDGTLTDYARGVLIANAAWTAWRAVVLLASWIGLWILSGQACAGLCGPRYRWQEEDAEKTMSIISVGTDDFADGLAWSWRECTTARVQEAYDFCLIARPPRWSHPPAPRGGDKDREKGSQQQPVPFEGLEQVLAAAGFPSAPLPARRSVLHGELFAAPTAVREFAEIIPHVTPAAKTGAVGAGPLMKLPYPFAGYPAQASSDSQQRIPFPPSPTLPPFPAGAIENGKEEDEEDDDEEEDEGDDEDEEEGEELEGEQVGLEETSPTSGRASGSMSSLGQPVASRYPFQFRSPTRAPRGGRGSVKTAQSKSGSSRRSRQSRSTGNGQSTDSNSPWSGGGSSGAPSPHGVSASPIPMPPRHPKRRERAGTTSSLPPWPLVGPIAAAAIADFPERARTHSASTTASHTFGPQPVYESSGDEEDDDEEDGGSEGQEDAEREDSVGLLSAGPSPRSSVGALRSRARTLSRPRSISGASLSSAARSRAQSLIQSLSAASRSSLSCDAIARSRTNSLAPLEEGQPGDNKSASGSASGSGSIGGLSSPEDHTFGMPMHARMDTASEEDASHQEYHSMSTQDVESGSFSGSDPVAESPNISVSLASEYSQQTIPAHASGNGNVHDNGNGNGSGNGHAAVAITRVPQSSLSPRPLLAPAHAQSYVSSANESFVTAPASVEGTSDSTGRTPSSWGDLSMQRYIPEHHEGANWRPV